MWLRIVSYKKNFRLCSEINTDYLFVFVFINVLFGFCTFILHGLPKVGRKILKTNTIKGKLLTSNTTTPVTLTSQTSVVESKLSNQNICFNNTHYIRIHCYNIITKFVTLFLTFVLSCRKIQNDKKLIVQIETCKDVLVLSVNVTTVIDCCQN
jgi:hypothetical protein